MTTVESAIRAELYRALQKLGADSALLSIVGGWGDVTSDDLDVLRGVRCWNEVQRGERRVPLNGRQPVSKTGVA